MPLAEIETTYLVWVLTTADAPSPRLCHAIRAEIAERLDLQPAAASPAVVRPSVAVREAAALLIAAGWRGAAKTAHPDAGGSHTAMLALNDARTFLERALTAGVVR